MFLLFSNLFPLTTGIILGLVTRPHLVHLRPCLLRDATPLSSAASGHPRSLLLLPASTLRPTHCLTALPRHLPLPGPVTVPTSSTSGLVVAPDSLDLLTRGATTVSANPSTNDVAMPPPSTPPCALRHRILCRRHLLLRRCHHRGSIQTSVQCGRDHTLIYIMEGKRKNRTH
jgi:hypothetical protein